MFVLRWASCPGVLVISGIQFAGEDSFVRITNLNTAVMTMIGWQLCMRPSYWEIPDISMEPEQVLDVSLGSGGDTTGKVSTNGALANPDPAGGDLALYTSTKFDRASAIFHYVQWGKADGGREEVAVKAEIWEAGAFIDSGPLADGGVLEYDGRVPRPGKLDRPRRHFVNSVARAPSRRRLSYQRPSQIALPGSGARRSVTPSGLYSRRVRNLG